MTGIVIRPHLPHASHGERSETVGPISPAYPQWPGAPTRAGPHGQAVGSSEDRGGDL